MMEYRQEVGPLPSVQNCCNALAAEGWRLHAGF